MSRKFEYSSLWNWNGNMVCAVDIESVGDKPGFHDLIQVCVLPLDSNFFPNKNYIPFYVDVKPRRIENYLHSEEGIKNKNKLAHAIVNGLDPDRAADLLEEWFTTKLKLEPNKRIIPLGHNYCHDRGFLIDWLGPLNYDHIFDARYRDVMTFAACLNDRSEFQVESQILFPKLNLQYLCSQLHVERTKPHDSMDDCRSTAEVYRAMIKSSL